MRGKRTHVNQVSQIMRGKGIHVNQAPQIISVVFTERN